MTTKSHFSLQAPDSNHLLRGTFYRPAIGDMLPAVIMLTGDGPKGTLSLSWQNMPPLLAEHGIASILFDFAGLGESDGDRQHLTLTVGLMNFEAVFKYVLQEVWLDKGRLAIFASSFGANVALLRPDLTNQVRALGLKSPACFLPDAYRNELTAAEFKEWESSGFSSVNGYDFEVFTDPLRYDTYGSAERIQIPTLITHGSVDEVVPVAQSRKLFESLGGSKRLEILEGASHGYCEVGQWDRMAALFVSFFKQELIEVPR